MQTFRRITLSIALLTCGVLAIEPAFLWRMASSVCLKGAYDFDGVDDYISVPMTMSQPATVSMWAKVDVGNTYGYLLDGDGSSGRWVIGRKLNGIGGASVIGIYAGVVLESTETWSGGWQHIVAVYNGASSKIYVDGVLEATGNAGTGSLTGGYLARRYTPWTNPTHLDGLISETRFYSEALTATQISDLYLYGRNPDDTNLEAWYRMDGDATDSTANGNDGTVSGAVNTTDPLDLPPCLPWPIPYKGIVAEYLFASDAVDTSGNSNDGTLNGDATADGTLTLDGTGDYVDLGTDASLSIGGNQPFTFATWFKKDTISTSLRGIFNRGAYNSDLEYNIYFGGSGSTSIKASASDGTSNNVYIGRATSSLSAGWAGEWHHLTVTWDGSPLNSGFNIYLDGVDSDTANFSLGTFTSTTNLGSETVLGALNSGAAYFFDGELDNSRFYDRELTADEILKLYSEGHD